MFSILDGYGAVPLDWPNARVVRGDAVEVVARLEEESEPAWKIFQGAADFDLKLLECRALDGRTQELVYRLSEELERTLAYRPTSRSVRR